MKIKCDLVSLTIPLLRRRLPPILPILLHTPCLSPPCDFSKNAYGKIRGNKLFEKQLNIQNVDSSAFSK